MAASSGDSFLFSLDPEGQQVTGFRFYYGDVGSDSHDDIAIDYLSLSSANNPAQKFFFERVSGVDLQGDNASAASDSGLILNGDISGDYPRNSDTFAYSLSPESLTISGSQISGFSNDGAIGVAARLSEINDTDGSVFVRLDWRNDQNNWQQLGTVSTSGFKEDNPDWQLISDPTKVVPPDTTAPTIWDSNDKPLDIDDNGILTLNQPENSTAVSDFNASEAVEWSLSGEDASLFTIDADGKLSFKAAPDFETPKDQGTDNTYVLTVVATDAAGNSSNQQLRINVGDQDENASPDTTAPTIWDSNDKPLDIDDNGILTLNQPENSTAVSDFNASEAVEWSLSGEDASLFTIDADGKLSFKAAPDFEDPKDNGKDNTYIVNVNAEDLAGNPSVQPVSIVIEDVNESPPPAPPAPAPSPAPPPPAPAPSAPTQPSGPAAPELVITPEGNGLFFDPGSESSADLGQWLEINLAMTPGLSGEDWVGVKVIDVDGSVRDLGGVGHVHGDDNQMLFSRPLLVQLKPNESLQLTRLNPPEVGGETTETVEFSSVDADSFRAVLGGDLVLNIVKSDFVPPTWEDETVSIQTEPSDGIFDFRQPDASVPLALQVKILGDSANINQLGLVRLDTDPATGDILGSVNGVLSTAGADFRAAVKANIQGFDGVLPSIGGGVYEQDLSWTLDADEQDAYALVMISQSGEVYTFGASTSADGRQHIKELGHNLFGFEDLAAGQGSDWDFNDVVVEIRTA